MIRERVFRDTNIAHLRRVGIRDEPALEPMRTTRNVGADLRHPPACARLSRRETPPRIP